MRRGYILIISILLCLSLTIADEHFLSGGTSGETTVESDYLFSSSTDGETSTAEQQDPELSEQDFLEQETKFNEETNSYEIDDSTSYYSVDTISPATSITTNQGKSTGFSMTNALFNLGSLAQGSFVSFENNNNLFWGSLFDASDFSATLDEGGELLIAQRNSFGNMGSVYISIENGNLTQDEVLVFVPDGDDPTYIYYNSTEIEFKDGEVYLFGESVTNTDNTDESTIIEFDEHGFTKIQLKPENNYTFFDYSIYNSGEEDLIICKNNALCDINIEDSLFTINGKFVLSEEKQIIINSFSDYNEISVDFDTGKLTTYNRQAISGILIEVYTGNHIIRETSDNTYEETLRETRPLTITSYNSELHDKEISISGADTLNFVFFSAYDSIPSETASHRYAAPETEEITTALGGILAYGLITIGILIFSLALVQNIFRKKKKGQMTIFVTIGLIFLIVLMISFYVISSNSTQPTNSLSKIESFSQATDSIEECMYDKIEESVYLLGEHGGYVTKKDSMSQYDTAYGVLTISSMEDSLSNYLERNISPCVEILDNTNFYTEITNRPNVIVSLSNKVIITIDSIGQVYIDGAVDSKHISEIEFNENIDFSFIHQIVNEMYSSDYGIPINTYENYQIDTYVNSPDYTEKLISVYDKENKFLLQVTKYLS
jgi:hypothetical protein